MAVFRKIQRPEREVDNLRPSNADVKSVHSDTYDFSNVFSKQCLIKPTDKYTNIRHTLFYFVSKSGVFATLSFLVFSFFFLLALQPPLGVVFYSPLVGFCLLAYQVS